jgi:O-antigen/teichoic acid export membrane protein
MNRIMAAKGAAWAFADLVSAQVLALGVFLVITRLITPRDFGLYALAVTFTAICNVVLVEGLSEALIQKAGITEDHRSSAFWGNLIFACVLAGALILFSVPLGWWFHHTKRFGLILRWLSPELVLISLSAVPLALFRRQFNMMVYPLRTIGSWATGGTVGITLALNGCGVWALVAQQLTIAGVSSAIVWFVTDWRPRFRLSLRALKDLIFFAFYNSTSNVILNFDFHIDTLVMGSFFNAQTLGLYSLALRILRTLNLLAINPIDSVVLPVLSRVTHDRNRFGRAYSSMVVTATAFWLPMSLGAGVIASSIVPLAFGHQWLGAVPVLQVMSLAGFAFSLISYTRQTLGAIGKPQVMTVLTVIQMVLSIVAYSIGAQYGLVAASAAWPFVLTIMGPIHVWTVRRYCGLDVTSFARDYLKIAFSGIAMAATVWGVQSAWNNVVIEIFLGGLVYLSAVNFLMPGYWWSLVETGYLALRQRATWSDEGITLTEASHQRGWARGR